MNTRNMTSVSAVAIALVAAFIYPASADQQLTKKWFPGHYLSSASNQDPPHVTTRVKNLLQENPELTGFKTLYLWAKLEYDFGVYDFSQIVADLDYAESVGKKMLLFISDRQFSSCDKTWPTPAYMTPESIYEGGAFAFTRIAGGRTECNIFTNYHVAPVMERLGALWTALGGVIDSHPALAGVHLQESALPGITSQPGYTKDKLYTNVLQLHNTIAAAFPTTPFTPYLSYASGMTKEQIDTIFTNIVEDKKLGFGDPDVFVDFGRNLTNKPFAAYWEKYKGVAIFGGEAQFNAYNENSAIEIVDFITEVVKMHFMVWMPMLASTNPNAAFVFDDVLAVLRERGFPINATPPSNLLVDVEGVPMPMAVPTGLRIEPRLGRVSVDPSWTRRAASVAIRRHHNRWGAGCYRRLHFVDIQPV